ncbi:uncharacterized protein LOC132309751 [Cornus florida]|uniref:uncharacterized protein LOC132309751 n=1 Tax=Cornus florida TaxID=4283 RepID=UPI0028A22AA0|nr:uncharacterized protein LOC132309751 [Cornus florida]
MAKIIPGKVKKVWDVWNLRGAVLFSLFLQVVLIFSAPSRKRTGNIIVTMIIWSAYLLADWVAVFAVGLILNGEGDDSKKFRVDDDLAAFWAPFLLLHLGGPDNITAFSLEDNELWIRHLLGLIVQLVAVVYVFTVSLPNQFWIPTVLFFAGTIKYAERSRALYLACLANFKDRMLPKPEAGVNYRRLMEVYSSKEAAGVPVEIEIVKEPEKGFRTAIQEEEAALTQDLTTLVDTEVVNRGHNFFKKFKRLLVDLLLSTTNRNFSRKFFFQMTCEVAFRVIEVELNFMYDVLFTKMEVVHRKSGFFFRLICSTLIAASFIQFASIQKDHQIHRIDVAVTYTLLIGAVGLDLLAHFKLFFSDWTIAKLNNSKAKSVVSAIREKVSFDNRCRWSKSFSQHNLIRYCLKERFKWLDKATDFFGLKEFFDEMQYKETKLVEDNLKKFIFSELRAKGLKAKDSKTAKEIFSARGDWVLWQNSCYHASIVSTVSEEVEYDESLLLWHIATELCYFNGPDRNNQNPSNDEYRQFSKLLSEYMLYLLIMRPTMMSSTVGDIWKVRFQDTCEDARKIIREDARTGQSKSAGEVIVQKLMNCFRGKRSEPNEERKKVCVNLLSVNTVVKPVEVKGDRSKSLLFDACMLAKALNEINLEKRWEIMSKVWVELLSYAACHCKANIHAQHLSKGGELITFVWLLMTHFGLGEQFRIDTGHGRAKLIVGK